MGAHLEDEIWSRQVLAQRQHALTFKARKHFATHSYLKDNLILKSPTRKIIVLKIIGSFYVTVLALEWPLTAEQHPAESSCTPGTPHLTREPATLYQVDELESQRSQTLEM